MAEFYVAVEALIEKDGKYLMVEEGKDHVHGKWATPGGGAEYGENPVDAIKREIKEETGLEADVVGLIAVLTGEADYDGHPVFDFVFKAEVDEGEPKPVFDQEVLSAEFKSKKEIEELDLRNDVFHRAIEADEPGSRLDIDNFSDFVNL